MITSFQIGLLMREQGLWPDENYLGQYKREILRGFQAENDLDAYIWCFPYMRNYLHA